MLDSEHLSCDQNVAEILASANPTSLWVKGSTCSSELVVRNWFAASNIHVLWITFESAVCDLACTVLWEGDSVMGLSTRLQTSTFFLQFLISSDEGLPLVFPHIFRRNCTNMANRLIQEIFLIFSFLKRQANLYHVEYNKHRSCHKINYTFWGEII